MTETVTDPLAHPVFRYGFIHAKLRSRLSKLLDQRSFDRLRQASSLAEAVQLLKNSSYRDEALLYEATGDLKEVEAALWRREIATLAELKPYMKAELSVFLDALLLRYEIDIVRNSIRLWFDAHLKKRSIGGESGYLYQHTLVHSFSVDEIVNAENFDSLLEAFTGTPYQELMKNNREDIEVGAHLFRFETDLDLFFYEHLLEASKQLPKRDREIALRITAVEIDLRNVDRIARLAYFYAPEERSKWHITIPGGTFTTTTLDRAVAARKGGDALKVLIDNAYGSFSGDTGSPEMLEELLRRIRKDEIMKLLRGYPFTIGIVLAYIFLKRKEIGALVTLLNVHYYGAAGKPGGGNL